MTEAELTRRRFLRLAASAVAGFVLVPWRAGDALGQGDRSARYHFQRRSHSARAVGRAYLEAVPEEADADFLLGVLATRLPGGRAGLPRLTVAEMRRALRSEISTDFGRGRVVELHGWVLSRTEARLCALAALAL